MAITANETGRGDIVERATAWDRVSRLEAHVAALELQYSFLVKVARQVAQEPTRDALRRLRLAVGIELDSD